MPDFVHVYNQGGGIRDVPVSSSALGIISTPVVEGGASIIYKFPGVTVGRLLASLVAGATATRVGLTVTVTATAHGIPSGTYSGSDFFFPGCPSLIAGWYPGFLYVSEDSVQFSLPAGTAGTNFSGESVNGGAAYTTATAALSIVLPAGAIQNGSRITAHCFSNSSTVGSNKYVDLVVGTQRFGRAYLSNEPYRVFSMTVVVDGSEILGMEYRIDHVGTASSVARLPVDLAASLPVSVFLFCPSPAQHLYLPLASVLEVVK